METLREYIRDANKGDKHAKEKVLLQMEPLIIKYALRIHCMEFEDAKQELWMTLLECLPYLDEKQDRGKILKYIEQTIIHKYYYLCKKNLALPEFISLDDVETHIFERQEKIMENNDFLQDLKIYIQDVMDKDKIKAQILYFSIFNEYSDNEISK